MLEWLRGDTMNGFVITISFFVSLIAGRYLAEYMDSGSNRGIVIEPVIRLVFAFLLITAMTIVQHWYIPAIVSVLCMIIAHRIKMLRIYCKYLIMPLVMVVFIIAVRVFPVFPGADDARAVLPGPSWDYVFLIFSRVFASASVLIILFLTTSENELLGSLRMLRIPSTILEISSFMIRYIKAFSYEGNKLRMAQEALLGYSGSFMKKMSRAGMICALLITRTFSRSKEIYRAMLSRGWKKGTGCLHEHQGLGTRHILPVFLIIFLLAGIILLDAFI